MSIVRGVESLAEATLLSPLPLASRVDIVPFAALHVITLAGGLLSEEYGSYFLWTLPVFVLVHALVYLSAHWSMRIRSFLRYRQRSISELSQATHVLCVPAPHCGTAVIRPLVTSPSASGSDSVHFLFQQIVLRFDRQSGQFRSRSFPDRAALDTYSSSNGFKTVDEIRAAAAEFGANEFAIPSPEFWEIFQEHATAPFFVFQIFCVGLWCLDEYWYYSIMTLVLLVIFEMTVVKRRMRTLEDVRNMRQKPHEVQVWREGRWVTLFSDALLPGDLVSLPRPKQDTHTVPCDCLLLRGECVVNESLLTGESIPQMKDSLSRLLASKQASSTDALSLQDKHKSYVLFGGTQIQMSSWKSSASDGDVTEQAASKIKNPADGGCICYVLRTGFDTTQGSLMRTILFSTERVTVNNWEALAFIGILLIFAVAASAYVLIKGLEDEARSRYKLLLHCVMIITSVVPPELPMELSLAVNNSLIALQKLGIFCTEPFRIPMAGAVDVCCFDKTGTLTSDDFHVRGIAGLGGCADPLLPSSISSTEAAEALTPAASAWESTKWVLAACNALVHVDSQLIGDPVEKSALGAVNFSMSKGDVATSKASNLRLRIVNRFPFASELKRMSTLVAVESDTPTATSTVTSRHVALCKGAPEEIGSRLKQVPEHYQRCYQYFSLRGFRVLALAVKEFRVMQPAELRTITRADCESGLSFAGFLVLSCPLKSDSASVVRALRESSHRVTMITGDHALTACQVAAELQITTRETLILQAAPLQWQALDGTVVEPFSASKSSYSALAAKHDFCLTGAAVSALGSMAELGGERALGALFQRVAVFARTSPSEKERVVTALRAAGAVTLMAGDGSNDTMALKNAHVGVALLSGNGDKKKKEVRPKETPSERQLREAMEDSEPKLVKMGDASIAAPFSTRSTSIECTLRVIRQGRCTLVTTFQMYKILALNCLVSAYSLSVLTLDGVKFGDVQQTVGGMSIAMFFLFISWSKPIEKLSAERPQSSVFSPYMMLSIVLQFALHLYTLISAVELARPFTPTDAETRDPNGKFAPNMLNSVVFLVGQMMNVATFGINYSGRPFMEGLRENKALFYGLSAVGTLILMCVLNISPDLMELMELVPFPNDEIRISLVQLLLVDIAGAYLIENVLRRIFRQLPKKL